MWPPLVNSRMQYIKYCLIMFTCLFVLSGISFIILGSSINAIYSDYSYFLHIKYFSPSFLLTAVGFMIFVVACLGLYGSLKESPLFILAFGFSLGVLFILQMTAGLTNYLLMGGVEGELEVALERTLSEYGKKNSSTVNMDRLQEYFDCCGVFSFNDYNKMGTIPKSCCLPEDISCTHPYQNGCLATLMAVTEYAGRILTIITYILSGMHLAGMFFAFYLGNMMREQKKVREAQRSLIRDQILNYSNDFDYNIKNQDELPPYSM